jgi:hypothetical protein
MRDQAKRIAWRIALEWLQVQMAFVETGARKPQEVFLADMIVEAGEDGRTLGDIAIAGDLPLMLDHRPNGRS